MNGPDLNLAPGCFGLAMTYRPEARECEKCPFAQQCAPLAAHNLAVLRAELGIAAPKAAPAAAERKITTAAGLVEPLQKKVVEQMERLDRLKVAVTPKLARGENPFIDKGPKFLAVACHVLLKIREGIPREALVACFMKKLGHTEKTATALARQTVQFLEAIGAGHELNGRIQLRAPN